jgi:hypothetical protein
MSFEALSRAVVNINQAKVVMTYTSNKIKRGTYDLKLLQLSILV